ncbi:MAG: hypothetical protein VXA09_00145 [Burkholderiaceae bacterium]
MAGFEALKSIKENMMKPVYEKRRHLGCEWCGTTFYGYYTKDQQSVYDMPRITEEGASFFLPPCPNEDCGMETIGVYRAKTAVHNYNKRKEKEQKKAERKAKKDAEPVLVSRKLTYPNRKSYEDRINHLASNPDDMTKYEMMCDYFLDKVFWKKFGAGRHSIKVRNFTIKKRLWDGTYTSNSGKSRMGRFTPYFIITNEVTGKVREIGKDAVLREIDLKDKYGTNRRNDPKRNWGLPGSRD